MSATQISGIILAAGASRRLGEPKQLLDYAGEPLLRAVVSAAVASTLREVVLVLGCRSREIQEALDLPGLLRHLHRSR